MSKPRRPETNVGIQGTLTVGLYDKMQRRLRDRGWLHALLDKDQRERLGYLIRTGTLSF
jgi:hypothetical protein